MRYSGILYNDMSAAPGVSVSFFVQGCPIRCTNCHNPESWDFDGGKEFTSEILDSIIDGLTANNIQRNLCIMGGEPLCKENIFLTYLVIKEVKEKVPNTKVYIWSGYEYENIKDISYPKLQEVLEMADVLIDGPYKHEERDITLHMRGSKNQRIIDLSKKI